MNKGLKASMVLAMDVIVVSGWICSLKTWQRFRYRVSRIQL